MTRLTEFFDRLYLDRHFSKNENGETAVFPFGRNRCGYLLPSDKEAEVKRAMRLQFLALFFAGLSFAIVCFRMSAEVPVRVAWFGWLALVFWFGLFVFMLIYARFSLVRGLMRV